MGARCLVWFLLCGWIMVFPAALFGQSEGSDDEELPDMPVTVTFEFIDGYIWRGIDFHTTYAQSNNEAPGEHTGAWTFAPSIDIALPLEGLSVNFWFAFALEGRRDTDVDQLWNNGSRKLRPADMLSPTGNYGADDPTNGQHYFVDSGSATATALFGSSPPTIGFDKEATGLDRFDEMDVTFTYARETSRGTIGIGQASYVLTDKRSKNLPLVEMFVFYTAPVILDPTLTMYTDLQSNGVQLEFSVAHDIPVTESIAVNLGAEIGYHNGPSIAASTGESHNVVSHYGGLVGLSAYGFWISYNFHVRPDTRWVDTDAGSNDFAWVLGESNNRDSLQEDYARSQGFANSYVNDLIETRVNAFVNPYNISYSYTPRSKIPALVWWTSIGYSFSI